MKIKMSVLLFVMIAAPSVFAGKGKGVPGRQHDGAFASRLYTRANSPEKPQRGEFVPAIKGEKDAWGFGADEIASTQPARRRSRSRKSRGRTPAAGQSVAPVAVPAVVEGVIV